MISPQERKEECRHEVRAYLVERQALAFNAATVHRRLKLQNDFSLEEVSAALAFLVGLDHASSRPDPDGATLYYQATSEGVLFHERRFCA